MIKRWINQNVGQLYNEIWGEETTYPLIRRLLAFTVDCISVLLITMLCWTIIPSNNNFGWLEVIGIDMAIGLLYFTILNSKISSGQTLGKRIFHIKIINENGGHITLLKSFFRSLPIVLLINFNTIGLAMSINEMPAMYFINGLQCILFGILYFSLFKANRQGLHDLIVSTQVVTKKSNPTTSKNLTTGLIIGYLVPVTIYIVWTLNHFQ